MGVAVSPAVAVVRLAAEHADAHREVEEEAEEWKEGDEKDEAAHRPPKFGRIL